MNVKFYPLKALSLFLLLWVIGTGAYAQTMTLNKAVINVTTGGNGSTAKQGDVLEYTITVQNTSSSSFTSSKLYDNIPSGVSYVSGSTKLNGSTVSDVSGKMPYAGGGLINTPTSAAGVLASTKTATIVFRVAVTANAGSIRNYANVDATQSHQSNVYQTNTVFTNLISDALCGTIFQSVGSSNISNTYNVIQDMNLTNGEPTSTSSSLYDGPSGPCYDASTTVPTWLGYGQILTSTQSTAAIAYDKNLKRIYFVLNAGGKPLCYLDLNNPTIAAYQYTGYNLETSTCGTCNVNRMCVASDGTGYALTSSAGDLIKWTINSSTNMPVITRMGALSNDVTNGANNVLTEQGGDIFGDGSGKLYLIANSSKIYKIDPTTRVATYMGTATPSPGTSQAIAIDLSGNVYIGGAYGTGGASPKSTMVYKIDLFTMAITPVSSTFDANVYNSGDYTSCAYPVLASNIQASKTFKNKNGSATVVGGDTVTYVITISNTGNFNAAGVKLYDYIPASTHYVPGSSTLNGTGVPDNGGVMPYAVTGGAYVNSPGESAGIIKTGASNAAVMTFDVVTDPNKTICNQSKITLLDADGNIMFVNSSDPSNAGQTPTCFYSDDVLPLTDLKLKGSLNNSQQSVINWSMTRDENITAYNVQYSDDGVVFKTIGTVVPSGSVNTLNQYLFTDVANTSSSIRYYRLELVQKGGTINYSGIVRLNVKAIDFQVLPNPFDKSLNLQFELKSNETVKIRLLDFSGREVYSSSENYSSGGHSVSLILPSTISKGMYMLDVVAGSEHIFQKKLIRQ